MSKPVGVHWANGRYGEAADLGFSFVWMSADTLGDPAYADDWRAFTASGLDFVLHLFMTEARLTNAGGCWERDCANALADLRSRGLLPRLLAIQLHDELHTQLAHVPSFIPAAHWPALVTLPPALRLAPVNVWLGQRVAELRAIWGAALPPHGIGIAEAGGVQDCTFSGLDWIGLNVYLGPGYYPDAAAMRRVYDAAAAGPYPLMPVLGVFSENGRPAPSLWELGAAYGPILAAHEGKCWALGCFLLAHPGGAHGQGQGLLDLPPAYREAVSAFARQWRA